MKIIRFLDGSGGAYYGQWVDDAHALVLRGELFGEHAFDERQTPVARRLAPVVPPNIIAIGRNYAEHAREMKADAPPEEPLIFLKATTSVIGPEDPIVLPHSAPDEVDYEAELAVIIGRTARDLSEADALDHVFGYTCANDVSARDCQKRRDKQWARGKSFDTFCPLGPHIVTTDELSTGRLAVRSHLNGALMQNGSTADMLFSVARLISYLSHQFTLLPGTVILTGTPAGVGSARTPPVYLRPGDVISVEIEGIGTLTNRVVGSDR